MVTRAPVVAGRKPITRPPQGELLDWGMKTTGLSRVPLTRSVPFTFRSTPGPRRITLPGPMVSVTPAGTVRLAVTLTRATSPQSAVAARQPEIPVQLVEPSIAISRGATSGPTFAVKGSVPGDAAAGRKPEPTPRRTWKVKSGNSGAFAQAFTPTRLPSAFSTQATTGISSPG